MLRESVRRVLLENGWTEDRYENFKKEIVTPKGTVQQRRIKLMGLTIRCEVQVTIDGYKEWHKLGSSYYRDIETRTLPDGNLALVNPVKKWLCRLHSA